MATGHEPRIISASRRTDIPAHYSDWFLRRLEAGFCHYLHPFSKRWFRVSLRPEDVLGLVLWSKDFGHLLPHLPAMAATYCLYCHLTITGHPREVEPRVIATDDAIDQLRRLSDLLGAERVVWRFDPIVFTQHGRPEATLDRARTLAARLEGRTQHCIISFMSPYRRQRLAFESRALEWDEPSPTERRALAEEIAGIVGEHGMALSACCNPDVVGGPVGKAACVSADRLRSLGAPIPARWPAGPTRESCGCDRSIDIGAYDTCPAGCAYCYANQDAELARRNHAAYDPSRSTLQPGADPTP